MVGVHFALDIIVVEGLLEVHAGVEDGMDGVLKEMWMHWVLR